MNERFALAEEAAAKAGVSGKINHSACKWCYKGISLDDLCTAGKPFGLHAIDLLDPADFATMKKHEMHCPMVSFPSAEVEIGGVKKGTRPSFERAARPERAIPLYEQFLAAFAAGLGKPVGSGEFGAMMQVGLINDGPVTIWLDSRNRE